MKNAGRIASKGLNLGIREAHGDIILRLDAHCLAPNNYISTCVKYLLDDKADNVGGVLKAVSLIGAMLAAGPMSKLILITGGARFIGSHLSDTLIDNTQVLLGAPATRFQQDKQSGLHQYGKLKEAYLNIGGLTQSSCTESSEQMPSAIEASNVRVEPAEQRFTSNLQSINQVEKQPLRPPVQRRVGIFSRTFELIFKPGLETATSSLITMLKIDESRANSL